MSRLNNEGVTRASSGILGALKEAENLKVSKVVLSDGAKAVETRKLTESEETDKKEVCPKCHKEQCVCKEGEELEESNETPEGAEQDVPGEGKEPLQEDDSMTNEEKMAKAQELFNIIFDMNSSDEEKENAKKELRVLTGDEKLGEEAEASEIEEPVTEECEEKMVEGLQIVDVKGNTVLLKESKGFIVGKDYDKSTGIIKEAEEYRTEKFAKKAFERLANK